jgi:mycothiol synthase
MLNDSAASLFLFRAFLPDDDLPRLAALFAEIEAVDQSGEDVSEAKLRELFTAPGYDAARDQCVVEMSGTGELVAFASIWRTASEQHVDMLIAVHPAWRLLGIGGALLDRMLARANELRASDVLAYADRKHQAAQNFARQHQFEPVAAYTAMLLSADTLVDTPVWPAGYQVRPYSEVQNFSILLQAFNRCYDGLWGHHTLSEDDLKGWFPSINQEGLLLLFASGEDLVGMCRTELSAQLRMQYGKSMGYIDSPGVVPEYRDQNLYLPLVQNAVRWLRSWEPVDIELESWGDTEQTIVQYETSGFRVIRKQDIFRFQI